MNTVDVLKGAKALLVTKGWHRGSYANVDGCLCSVSALNLASARRCAQDVPNDDPSAMALASAMGLTDKSCIEWDIIGWNDFPGRTVQEVLAVFDKAIAAEEAKA